MNAATGAGQGLKVGSIAGVPVHIGSSWLVLAGIIIVITGTNTGGTGRGYLLGALYALALLLAVLIHEAAHAVTAQRLGLTVHRIVADLWGGHTAYDASRVTAGRAALVAVAGPAANAALGIVAWAGQAAAPEGLPRLFVWGVAWTNLLLAAFNLLPGLPLDGGQLVESAVWGVTGRRDRGLVVAGWCGRAVAALVVLWFAVAPLLAGRAPDLTAMLWILLVAGFMWVGAGRAIGQGRIRGSLAKVKVRDVARRAAVVDPATPIATVLTSGVIAVCLDERAVPSLVLLGTADRPVPEDAPVSAALTRVPDTAIVEVGADEDVTAVVQAMAGSGWGLAVLTEHHRVYAVVDAARLEAALDGRTG